MKAWKLKPTIPSELSDAYRDYPPLLSQLLFNRGLIEKDKIEKFLKADYNEGLNSPFLFRDMKKAVARIWTAIENKEKIFIYGDYDADAITANAVLRQTFSYLGADCESYIPDRFAEGYGVNLEALEKIKGSGSKIIVTVDCGTNSVDAAEWCNENGIDFIITDHHEIIGEAPDAFALINPKNSSDNYPDDQIVGVGVAFKLAQALLQDPRSKKEDPSRKAGWEKWLLDLVAIGTVADCHELLGENRIFVKYGLKVLEKSRWIGLRALVKSSSLDFSKQKPDTYALGFVIAPRINAAGRLEHANLALDLLLEENLQLAQTKAEYLEEVNKRRQDITARIMSEAREKVIAIEHRKVLVLMSEGWHKGVVGLVAGKIAEEYYKPTIILEQGQTEATGSARTAGEFDVVEALKYSSAHLLRFGGHKQAAGLTLAVENFENFYKSLLEFAENKIDDNSSPVLHLDTELKSYDLSVDSYQLIELLEPYGVGNPRPKFLIKNCLIQSFRLVGKEKQHLQMQLKVGDNFISSVAFNFGNRAQILQTNATIDVVCEFIKDLWNGQEQLKLRIIDLKISNEQIDT